MRVYISGALTNVPHVNSLKLLYESIGKVCVEYNLDPYIPHMHTDPLQHPNLTPAEVFANDKEKVSLSSLVIAYVGYPSIGVGMEIGYAEVCGIPVILLYEKDAIVSRFPRGIPNLLAEISFVNHEDALSQIRKVVMRWVER